MNTRVEQNPRGPNYFGWRPEILRAPPAWAERVMSARAMWRCCVWGLVLLLFLGGLLDLLSTLSGFTHYTHLYALDLLLNAAFFLVCATGLSIPLVIAAALIWILI